jgi:hypothetical protein
MVETLNRLLIGFLQDETPNLYHAQTGKTNYHDLVKADALLAIQLTTGKRNSNNAQMSGPTHLQSRFST